VNKTVKIVLVLLIIIVAIVLVAHFADLEGAMRKLHGG
jgi:hypothetical protein